MSVLFEYQSAHRRFENARLSNLFSSFPQRKNLTMAKSLPAAIVDRARPTLCRRACECFRNGAATIRIRRESSPAAVWTYEKQDRSWKKHGEAIEDARLIEAIDLELDNFATRRYDAALTIRKTAKPDWMAIDLTFPADELRNRMNSLESYVYGVLFYKHPDHEHDIRQRIRRGPRATVRR